MAEISIKNPREGIAQSPHVGYGDIRNLDLHSIPGIVRLNNITVKKSGTIITALPQWIVKNPLIPTEFWTVSSLGLVYKSTDSGVTWSAVTGNTHTFTVTIASPAVVSATAHGFTTNDRVIFTTTGALPTGLVAGKVYYIISTGLTADAFQLAATLGGAAINTSGSQSGIHSFLTNGAGLAIWKDYLFVPRASSLDVYGPLTLSPTWTLNWKKIDTDGLWHPMIISKNDFKLYGGADKYVFSLDEATAPFVPATSASYTFTQQALDLPFNYRIKCLEELGNNLMCGTWQGTNVYDLRIADIFPWDRSATSFGQPVIMSENGVHAMLNIGNSLIVLAGVDGKIYICDGVNATQIGQIPQSIANIDGGKNIAYYPGAITNYKGRIFFGVSGNGTDTIGGMGVYSLLRTSKGNILIHEHTISTLTDGTSNVVKIGALCGVIRDNILIGWSDATPTASQGIDNITNTSYLYTTDYSGYFESPFYTTGSLLQQTTPTEIEFNLVRPLRTGEGIRLAYRTDLTASYTTIGTYTFATEGAVVSVNKVYDFPPAEQIQFKVSLLGSATTSPEMKGVSIRW